MTELHSLDVRLVLFEPCAEDSPSDIQSEELIKDTGGQEVVWPGA